jgi:hypothetical protein
MDDWPFYVQPGLFIGSAMVWGRRQL